MAEEDVIVQLQDDRTVSRRLKEHLESLDKIICYEKNTDFGRNPSSRWVRWGFYGLMMIIIMAMMMIFLSIMIVP